MTITIPLWLPVAYLTLGAALWLPLEWFAWKNTHRAGPFWQQFPKMLRKRPWVPLMIVVAWPLAVWEEVEPKVRRWRRARAALRDEGDTDV